MVQASSPLFVEKVTRDVTPRETASLFRARDILGLCQGLKVGDLPGERRERRERRDLQHLQYHDALQAAWGAEIVAPHHLGSRILRDAMVLDCFPVERRHRLLKAYASHLRSGPGFERRIFARSILASAHIAVAAREDALLRGEVLCEADANN